MNPEKKKIIPKPIRNAVGALFATLALSGSPAQAKDLDKSKIDIEAVVDDENLDALFDVAQQPPLVAVDPSVVKTQAKILKESMGLVNIETFEETDLMKGFENFCLDFEETCNEFSNEDPNIQYQRTLNDEIFNLITKLGMKVKINHKGKNEEKGKDDWRVSWVGDCEDFMLKMMEYLIKGEGNIHFSPLDMKMILVRIALTDLNGKDILDENGKQKYGTHAVLGLTLKNENGDYNTIIFDVNSKVPLSANQFLDYKYKDLTFLSVYEPVMNEFGQYEIKAFNANWGYMLKD